MKYTFLIIIALFLYVFVSAGEQPKQPREVKGRKVTNGGLTSLSGHLVNLGANRFGTVWRCNRPFDRVCVYVAKKYDDTPPFSDCGPDAVSATQVIDMSGFPDGNIFIGVDNSSGGITYAPINTITVDCKSDPLGTIVTIDPALDLIQQQQ
jgi:hypothetical protein